MWNGMDALGHKKNRNDAISPIAHEVPSFDLFLLCVGVCVWCLISKYTWLRNLIWFVLHFLGWTCSLKIGYWSRWVISPLVCLQVWDLNVLGRCALLWPVQPSPLPALLYPSPLSLHVTSQSGSVKGSYYRWRFQLDHVERVYWCFELNVYI